MRRWFMRRAAPALVLLALLSDGYAASAIRRSTSFVVPTSGSAHALTLTTYVTDAADLHYAAVLSGHVPLEAAEIKSAAQRCLSLSESSSVVQASTVAVERAQKVERQFIGLRANTSYDVYFVAEVPNSNGVYGAVLSVLGTVTHASPPVLVTWLATPANGSATAVTVNITLSTPGLVHLALIPKGASGNQQLTIENIVTTQDDGFGGVAFAREQLFFWDALSTQIVVDSLSPATEYALVVVTEALGNGGVYSELYSDSDYVVRTHAPVPDIARLSCSATRGSSSSVEIAFQLQFSRDDVTRATAETVALFQYQLHYEVEVDTTTSSTAEPDMDRGSFSLGNFSTVNDLVRQETASHTRIIEGLDPATSHTIRLFAETKQSHGVVGRTTQVASCGTHAVAPLIMNATAQPTNGTVHALDVHVELARAGNIHYVLAPRASMQPLRNSHQRAANVEELLQLVIKGSSTEIDGLRTGVVSTEHNASSISFSIDGLEDATAYAIALIPETIGSFGVFGEPFTSLLDATTNENASHVELLRVDPSFGSLSRVKLEFSMAKPLDVLFVCIAESNDETVYSEVPSEELQQQPGAPFNFSYTMANLTEDTEYSVSLYTESRLRNGVVSARTPMERVKTQRPAPEVVKLAAQPLRSRVDAVTVRVELGEPGMIHYIVVVDDEAPTLQDELEDSGGGNSTDTMKVAEPLTADAIVDPMRRPIEEKQPPRTHDLHSHQRHQHQQHHNHNRNHDQHTRHAAVPPPATNEPRIIKRGQVFTFHTTLELLIEELTANTTYSIHVVSETATTTTYSKSNAVAISGVYGTPKRVAVATHDIAPVIVKSTADPLPNRTDSIVLSANLTRPGIVHYQLTDVDFADPSIIKSDNHHHRLLRPVEPHVLRGSFAIHFSDMGMEILNGTNDTTPMQPMVFATNFSIFGLREATTYHVSLTTETFDSGCVFGGFPAPLLVTTHAPPPRFVPETLRVGPVAGSSSSLSMDFRLDTLGEVHYALFFRGLVADRTTEIYGVDEQRRHDEEIAAREIRMQNASYNASLEPPLTPRWPPPANTFYLTQLTARALKDAEWGHLGDGVWGNDTISVTRDDVFHRKLSHKTIDKLPPSATFDVCLVPETAASDGIFAPLECHHVATHADYTNQSVMFDDVAITPVQGTTDGVHIRLQISKLLDAPEDTSAMVSDPQRRVETATGRVPYFVLVDGHDGRPEFTHHSIVPPSASRRHDKRTVSPFKLAVAGRSHVTATGQLTNVTAENATFVAVEHTVRGLLANHRYFFFFAYETANSDGVFTEVNPHRNRPKETLDDQSSSHARHRGATKQDPSAAIEVTTFDRAPPLKSYEAVPTYGNTSRITVGMDASCKNCEETVVHILVVHDGCPTLSTDLLLASAREVATVQSTLGTMEHGHLLCELPLIYKRLDVNMTERDDGGSSGGRRHNPHHRHHSGDSRSKFIETDVEDAVLLQPNTTYQVWIATETARSGGVVSESFHATRVTTFPSPPRFVELRVQPRKGSTTELLLVATLDQPGEVHYMLGKSGNPELNVSSPFNVSGKSLPGNRDSKFHDYGRDVVRTRRSFTIHHAGETHVEVIDYLVAGTSYDVFVVSETEDDSGIYGDVLSFPSVSTFPTPPMLLAHTAYPTPGTVDSLSVGFRVEANVACVVHISVITSTRWSATSHVADGSDTFGNRLAMDDRFIARHAVVMDGSESRNGDGGWQEVNISVPLAGTNYTVFLVTETKDSDGVYGTVATHSNVLSHPEPPLALNVSVRPTDARVDALTVDVTLSRDQGGHVHYAVLRHRQRFTRSAIATLGHVDVNGSKTTNFTIDGLTGRTAYDVYLRLESLESHGVMGEWSPFPVTATTHGLPAEVLESVECEVSPSCASIGRHACSHVMNVCGECLDGFDGISGSSNAPCRALAQGETSPTIKISGVRINPRHRRNRQPESTHDETEATVPPVEISLFAPETGTPTGSGTETETATMAQTESETEAEAEADRETVETEAEVDADAASVVRAEDASVCPANAHLVGPGKCECEPGFEVDAMGTTCVPSFQHAQSMAIDYTSHAL